MPKAGQQVAKPTAPPKPVAPKPAAPAKAKAPPREVEFPKVTLNGHVILSPDKLRISATKMRQIMGWESEDEYLQRRVKEDPSLGLKTDSIKFGSSFLLIDNNGQKVKCSRNSRNRPFDENTARGYEQDVLHRTFLFNGEAFIIDEYGDVISGQHRGAALILAAQRWAKDPHWKKYWSEEPWIEAVIVAGVKGTQEVRATLDNVRPRQLSDTIYTSDTFATMDEAGRKECSRMMDAAADLLWKRTGMAFEHLEGGVKKVIQTHSASHAFLDRHPKLRNAVKHLWEENRGRAISMLKLSAGQMAALCYLFGASDTTEEQAKAYHASPEPSEKMLDLSKWDLAEEFFTVLAGHKEDKTLRPLATVLSKIVNGDFGTLELGDKKIVAVVNAWNEFSAGKKGAVTEANIAPAVVPNQNTEKVLDLDKLPVIGGIDLGQSPEPDDDLTEEEIAANKQAAKDARAAELAAKRGLAVAGTANFPDLLAKLRAVHGDAVLLFQGGPDNSEWSAWSGIDGSGLDDERVEEAVTDVKTKIESKIGGLRRAFFPTAKLEEVCSLLRVKGRRPLLVTKDAAGNPDVKEAPAIAKPAAPKAGSAPANANGTAPTRPQPTKKGPALRPGNASR